MKKSIIFAILILLITVSWLGSGQIGKVNAKDKELPKNETNEIILDDVNETEANVIKVETKKFIAEQIDQSIILQGQTIYNKKIDVKSETTGNVISVNFKRGDKVKENKNLLNISLENRKEQLVSVEKDINRLKKELIINVKNRDNLLSKNSELINLYKI